MRVFITGMEGFVGSYLAEWALSQKAEVLGTAFPGSSRKNLQALPLQGVFDLDITDGAAVDALLCEVKPDWIFHLAGQSNPALSFKDPEPTMRANILGTLHVLESVRRRGAGTRVVIAGSADEYGCVDEHVRAISETFPLNPQSPYAVSKVCQDLMGLAYHQQHGVHAVRVRPFNHIGPRQALGFVATDFASQIVAIERGQLEPRLETGNLDVVRDFTDVRDIVRGYWSLAKSGKPGEVYNLGSGHGLRIHQLVDGFLKHARVPITVHMKHERIRHERMRKVASIARIRRGTGWKPELPISQTLLDILNDWRAR
ncbi:MAG: NAD-dependent epimerase/dehydratase family protein [Candidatus Firestonebacteria bacterium]|nr:NAD-dependent epimerase/dehydratase family protein [Candidatus Firestonebacteria bacterium]